MLPDFQKLKQEIQKYLQAFFQKASEQDQLLQMVGRIKHYEGDRTSNKSEDGYESESSYTDLESPMEILPEEIIAQGPNAFVKHGLAMAEDMKRQMIQDMFKHISEGVERVGNTVNTDGKPFSAELYLAALEKKSISFNDDGTPHQQTVVGVEEEYVKKTNEQLENDPKLRARYDEIMKKKKEEWDASEGDRKLVD